jgi:pyruvate kinase
MVLIAATTEKNIDYKHEFDTRKEDGNASIEEGIAHATVTTAHDLNAKAIITVTKRGQTARLISKYRPAFPIVGCTTDEENQRQMSMSWGVTPIVIDEETNTDVLFAKAVAAAKENGIVEDGDLVVITAGVPLGISGMTNMMKVERI